MTFPTTLAAAAVALREGRTSSVELTEHSLGLAESVGSRVGAFASLAHDQARRAAQEADAEFAVGLVRGPLHGVPVAVKDVLATKGLPTSAYSRAPKPSGFDGESDAACVRRLRAAGAVVMGKTSTMEFAKGLLDRDGPFPLPRNPWALDRWTGGSSCGSAAAVATAIVTVALGTDTGGSTRMPAAYCGVTGFKPTFAAISLEGCLALAPSMDHVGILARTAADCAAVFSVLWDGQTPEPKPRSDLPLRVGVDLTLPERSPTLDEPTYAAFTEALDALRGSGMTVIDLRMPTDEAVVSAARTVAAYENYQVFREALLQHGALFGQSARERLSKGAGIGADEYARARTRLAASADAHAHVMSEVDVLALPTTPGPAETLEDLYTQDRDRLVFTRLWSALGLPAISVPVRPSAAGLPLGMQLVGAAGRDMVVLRAAACYQRVTQWHTAVASGRDMTISTA